MTDDRAVIDYVVGTKAPSREARLRIDRLRSLFRGSHMLSQHDIRQFLERTKPAERFDILTNMVGAEDFVRFREKVANVLAYLHSHVRSVAEENRSLTRELEDVSTRLRERKKDLERQSSAVTAERSPAELSAELLRELRECQCTIDEHVISKAATEPEESAIELIAVHTQTVIRSKKAEIEDRLVKLKSLEQELPGYEESRTIRVNLAAEIAREKSGSVEARADLTKQEKVRQDSVARLQDLNSKQAASARRYSDITWLKEIFPAYRRSREILRKTEESLLDQREELQRHIGALESDHKSLSMRRARLQEMEEAIAKRMVRKDALVAIMERLPHVYARRKESDDLSRKEDIIVSQVAEMKGTANDALAKENTARAHLEQVQREYDSEAARNDLLSSFLARLAQLVKTSECPLCGRSYGTVEEALKIIRDHISMVPSQLRVLAGRLDNAKQDVERKRADFGVIAEKIRALGSQLELVQSNKMVAQKAVEEFLRECSRLGVTLLVEEPASWTTALREAREKCQIDELKKEMSNLKVLIKSLADRVTEQQNAVEVFQRKVSQAEKQRLGLIEEIQGLERGMVQRGFTPASLPQDDQLALQLSKAQDDLRVYTGLVAQKEAEIKVLDAVCVELQEKLRRAGEDVSSKENQLRQYEATYNRFIAACRAVYVDPENPGETIGAAMRKVSELNQVLSTSEEKRQVLQQVAGLKRLRLEIDGLERTERELRQRTELRVSEESRLHDWVSHVEGLEAEVVKQQVDVVGLHLERLEPTMKRLYRRLNPHPIFGEISIRVNGKTRELDVEAETTVTGEKLSDIVVSPPVFFSESQMNSLALTVFLGGALRQRWSAFNTILIDDPIQQMDEMNVYAFLDLIRGLSSQRQFIIFTCNRDFYLLALEKLDCLNVSNRGTFLAYRLEGIAPAELRVHRDTT